MEMWIMLLGLASALLASSRSEDTKGKKTRRRNICILTVNATEYECSSAKI
ncbi:hypothetical protein M9458_054141, partial [Cirrhinus mrigala]